MYKVFINERPVFLVSKGEESEVNADALVRFRDKKYLKHLLSEFRSDETVSSMCIWHFDLDELFYYFRRNHRFIHAAGGVVNHPENGLLCIERLGKWDLPKGKMEQGENPMITAIREVEEECGVDGLKITGAPYFTYHTYPLDRAKHALKKTWWFPMETTYNGSLEAQSEEGITQAVWMPDSGMAKVLGNTYGTISDVLHHFGSIK